MGVYSWAVGMLHADCTSASSIQIPWLMQCLCSGWSGTSRILCKLELSIRMVNYIRTYIHIYKALQFKSKFWHNGTWMAEAWLPTACVIAKQYSSATFNSLHFHSCKDKFGACFKNFILFIYYIYIYIFFFYYCPKIVLVSKCITRSCIKSRNVCSYNDDW
jgi:hypothetical protein